MLQNFTISRLLRIALAGHCQLAGQSARLSSIGQQERAVGALQLVLGDQLHSGYFIPSFHWVGAFGTVRVRFEPMTARAEVLANRSRGWKEALHCNHTTMIASY